MDDSDDSDLLRYADLRRDLERRGIKWNAPATVGLVFALKDALLSTSDDDGKQIAWLGRRVEELQKAVDHLDRHAMRHAGEWRAELNYPPNATVAHAGGLFVAMTETLAGRAEPSQPGSTWARLV